MSAAAIKILKGLKAFKTIVSSKGNEKGSGKRILIIILTVIIFLFFGPACAISLPGLIGKTGSTDAAAESYKLEDSQIFHNVNDTYMEYSDDLEERIEKRKEELKEEYSYTKEVEKKNKKGKIVKKEVVVYPEVVVITNTDNVAQSIVYAYIATKYIDVTRWDYDNTEILNFLNDNVVYKEEVSTPNKDTVNLIVTITVQNIDEIAEKYFTDEKIEAFKISCSSFGSMPGLDSYTLGDYANLNLGDLVFNEYGMKIPHYLQYDSKWGNRKYGLGTISSSGCGPTSMAMIISYLTDQIVTPDMTADWSMENGYYISGQGTSWDFFSGAAKHWSLISENIEKDYKKVVEALSNGRPVIASMSPGTFTKGGHFIVLRGITAEGKILVNDPNDNYTQKNFYKREFELSLIVSEAKNFWVISKP